MKKLTLFVIGIALTISAHTQDFIRVLRATKFEYQNEKWVNVLTEYPKEYFIVIKGDLVTIGATKFKTYGVYDQTTYDSHVTYTWKCINGNGSKCWFMMKRFPSEVTAHLVYSIAYDSGIMYEYEGE